MKKTIQKLMAALLAVAMLCAMAIPAFATDGDATAAAASTGEGKITINNAITGQTYTIYRILNLEYHKDTNSYRYTANEAWEDFVRNQTGDLKLDENTGAVTWINSNPKNNDTAIQKFANSAGTYAKDHSVQAVKRITAKGKEGEHGNADNSTSITFENLPLGWYLVVSDLVDVHNGALCSIDTTDPTVEIREKNSNSTLDKSILEGDQLLSVNNAGIGDVVNFQLDIVVKDGQPKGYVVHDKMSEGLTFNSNSVSVRHSDGNASGNLTTGYTLDTHPGDGCTFEVKFDDGTLKPNDMVTISYTATVNNKAVIAGSGNTNEAYLKYNNNSKTTVTHTTTTYVWGMGVRKYTALGSGKEDTPLADAEFQLYKMDGETKKYAKFAETGTNTSIYKLTGWDADASNAAKVKTPASGNIQFEGLDAGTYYLEETTAPTGYNKLTAPITVVISSTLPTTGGTASYTVTADGATTTDYTVRVENKAGTALPSTGGIGTTLFYVIGGGLMVAAIVLLVTKKRMENK